VTQKHSRTVYCLSHNEALAFPFIATKANQVSRFWKSLQKAVTVAINPARDMDVYGVHSAGSGDCTQASTLGNCSTTELYIQPMYILVLFCFGGTGFELGALHFQGRCSTA
jgi:hypothetical protein